MRAHVHADDVAGMDHTLAGYAVDDFVVDRDTGAAGKSAVAEEGRRGSLTLDILTDQTVDLAGGDTGLNRFARQLERPLPRYGMLPACC